MAAPTRQQQSDPGLERAADIVVSLYIDGGAFQFDPAGKAARLLREAADAVMSLKRGQTLERPIQDDEGNPIGRISVRIPDRAGGG